MWDRIQSRHATSVEMLAGDSENISNKALMMRLSMSWRKIRGGSA
jgi:hypothetical protein